MVLVNKIIRTPITEEKTRDLKVGDYVNISGKMYVARDAAHKRMIEALEQGKKLPINIEDSTIYYMGPSPAGPGNQIVCYEDLGAEAILEIEVENFPAIVVKDCNGNDLYEESIKEYCVL